MNVFTPLNWKTKLSLMNFTTVSWSLYNEFAKQFHVPVRTPPNMETPRVTPRRASWKPACVHASWPLLVSIPIWTCSGVSWVMLLGARAGNTTKRLWEEEGKGEEKREAEWEVKRRWEKGEERREVMGSRRKGGKITARECMCKLPTEPSCTPVSITSQPSSPDFLSHSSSNDRNKPRQHSWQAMPPHASCM